MKPKRGPIVNISVLPGEPTDGSGRVCIHLIVKDDLGTFVEPMVTEVDEKEKSDKNPQGIVTRPARCRLACDPRRSVAPVTRNGITTITMRTSVVEAVTCPKCVASADYKKRSVKGA